MVFGQDELNGKICDLFKTRATSRNCIDGNFKLTDQCVASSSAGPCDSILIDKDQEIKDLTEENDMLRGKLEELYEAIGVHIDF